MPTLIACPICDNPFTVEDAALGKVASCPGCGVRFTAKVEELELESDDEGEGMVVVDGDAAVTVDDFLFDGSPVNDVQELETILARRYQGNRNTFWMSHSGQEFPTLGLFVKDELAYLYFIPVEGEAGFCSQGLFGDLLSGDKTTFYMTPEGEEISVRNEFVISWPEALTAARDFLASSDLPPSIEWVAL